MKSKSSIRISLDVNKHQNTKSTKLSMATPKIINERLATENQQYDISQNQNSLTSKSHGQEFFSQFLHKPQQVQSQFQINQPKQQDFCKIKIFLSPNSIEFNVETTNLHSEQLVEILFQKIQAFTQQTGGNCNLTNSIIGFKTKEKYFVVDHILTKTGIPLQFLKKQNLNIQPIIKDCQLLQQLQNLKTNINSFQLLHMIGLGGFSRVFLARHHQTQKYYALKIIDKNFIMSNDKQEIILNERKIMINVQHPFIVKMNYAFQTKNFLIFAMEFCPGGDFFTHLKQLRFLTESQARIYFLQICLALSHLHHNGIVYRDLKPENILIDLNGNMKIADFGLSKYIQNDELAYSFCGSSEYMSPEMIKKEGHNYSVDYYGLGALLYEMVFGFPPYYQQNSNKMFQDILQKQLSFPSQIKVSQELKIFLSELLCKSPKNRLGSKNGIADIINHSWCKKVKLMDIIQKQVVPHLKPNPFVMYFEEFDQKQQSIVNEIKKEIPFESDQNFKNFYYEKKQSQKEEKPNQELSIEKKKTSRVPSASKNQHLNSRQNTVKIIMAGKENQERISNQGYNQKIKQILNIQKPQFSQKLLTPQNKNIPMDFGKRTMSPSQGKQFTKIIGNPIFLKQLQYNQ